VADFGSSSTEVQAKRIDNIPIIIRRRMHSNGTDRVMAQPHNNRGNFDEYFHDYIPKELIDQPDISSQSLSSFVAATEATI